MPVALCLYAARPGRKRHRGPALRAAAQPHQALAARQSPQTRPSGSARALAAPGA